MKTPHYLSTCLPSVLLALCMAGCGTPTTSVGTDSDSDSDATTGDSETTGEPEPETGGPPEPSELAGFNRFVLRVDDTPPPPLTLVMGHQDAIDFFGEQAKDLSLLNIDPTPLLENALLAIQYACGDNWEQDNKNPNHNCAQTPLGQTFGPNWQHSAEYSMVRLLSMTAANADMRGTELEDFANLMDSNPDNFPDGFAGMLADILEVERTDPLLPLGAVVAAVKQTLLVHPGVNEDGTLPVTLDDALKDMRPLAQKFGPVGEHPGVLLPDDIDNPNGFETKADALDHDEFSMKVVAGSNLRFVDGVDLSSGGGDMFLLRDDAENVLELKFTGANEDNLEITGIIDPPTMDMRMRINEFDGDVEACVAQGCQANEPTMVAPQAPETNVWKIPLWTMERLVGQAGYRSYKDDPEDFSKDISKDLCIFKNGNQGCYVGLELGVDPAPEGWAEFFSNPPFNIDFPDAMFFWELFVDIAEVAFHDVDPDSPGNELEEGAAPTYALKGLDIGLTADDLVAQIRQSLEDQEELMSELILGRYWKNNHALDFYYRRANDGNLYVFFANHEDLRPDPNDPNSAYQPAYENPGFFACPEVNDSCKSSQLNISGVSDVSHEKLDLKTGWNNMYVQDDLNSVYEVRFYVPENREPTKIWAYVRSVSAS